MGLRSCNPCAHYDTPPYYRVYNLHGEDISPYNREIYLLREDSKYNTTVSQWNVANRTIFQGVAYLMSTADEIQLVFL